MPINYVVDQSRNFIHVKADGAVDDPAFLAFEREFIDDRRIAPGFKALVELEGDIAVSASALLQALQLETSSAAKFDGSKTAMVAFKAGWDQASLFASFKHRRIIPFMNVEVAKGWLEVS